MRLNDPFGRVSRRDRARYDALRERLRQAGVRDAQALQGFAANISATMRRLLWVLLTVSLVLILLFPGALGPIILIAALILLWLVVSYVQTHLYLKRYRREECDQD